MSLPLGILQLRYFVALAEDGSFSHAAEREHVSQPSLSQQIQKLEEELNQQLFYRLPRSVVLTEAGRSLLPYARQILNAIALLARPWPRSSMRSRENFPSARFRSFVIPSEVEESLNFKK